MNLDDVFNLKLVLDDIYKLGNENIKKKACLIVEKSRFFEIRLKS